MLATGGMGNIYQTTTNLNLLQVMVLLWHTAQKRKLRNLSLSNFTQHHCYNPGEKPSFLITEAMRGAGAKLKMRKGVPFMKKYDKREELAPRDIVARAIDNEMKLSGDEFVYLDATIS